MAATSVQFRSNTLESGTTIVRRMARLRHRLGVHTLRNIPTSMATAISPEQVSVMVFHEQLLIFLFAHTSSVVLPSA